jgi:hypothetical protein
MRTRLLAAALVSTATLFAMAGPGAANNLPPECRRFASEATGPADLAPRLARLCVKLIEANASSSGLTAEERSAATTLGQYLGVLGELDLRKGLVGINGNAKGGTATTDTARYLIARRIGLLAIADKLAPEPRTASLH